MICGKREYVGPLELCYGTLVAYSSIKLYPMRRLQEANELAKQHGFMDVYSYLVAKVASREECCVLAR